MSRDIVRDNIDCYAGERARRAWAADGDLYEIEHEIVEHHFPAPPARVLDLGCGAGRTTLGLEARGFDVDAIDVSEDLLEEARRRVRRSRTQLMDARALAFEDACFDAALFSFNGLDCLHPSRERTRVLAEVHRVLRPGGVFYYSGHNGLGTWAPRPGDSIGKVIRRNTELLLAQRRPFTERTRYLAYPEANGTQILYSALPFTHLRELAATGFRPIAVYGARGASFRRGPHVISRIDVDQPGWWRSLQLGRLAVPHAHLHYVACKVP